MKKIKKTALKSSKKSTPIATNAQRDDLTTDVEGIDELSAVKVRCEPHIGPVSNIIKYQNSRNYVYRVSTQNGDFVYKEYNQQNNRGSSTTELWVYSLLADSKYTKNIKHQNSSSSRTYTITNYQEGTKLAELAPGLTDDVTTNHLALQLVAFIRGCERIDTQGYGRFVENGVGGELCWSRVLTKYIQNLLKRAHVLESDDADYLVDNLKLLDTYFKNIPDLLNSKKPVLTPVDLNLDNFIINDECQITCVDLESFWSSDILLALGDLVGNTYNTILCDAVLKQWGRISSADARLVHAYAMLSNLSALIYIAENTDSDIFQETPWGNENTYFSLIELHKKKLSSHHKRNLKDAKNKLEHVSIRHAQSPYMLNFLGGNAQQSRVSSIIRSVRRFCNIEFNRETEDFYVLIYGSYAYGCAQAGSDLDIVFAAESISSARKSRIIKYITTLHNQFGMQQDNEIPYDKKALISLAFIKKACEGEGIRHGDTWSIEPIVKTKKYLASDRLLLRFLQGMLSNPHLFVDGSYQLYSVHRKCATYNLIKAVLFENDLLQISAISLLDQFCFDKHGNTGDFFLGFSYNELFKSYLSEYLESVLNSIKRPATIGPNGAIYTFSEYELKKITHINELEQVENKISAYKHSVTASQERRYSL